MAFTSTADQQAKNMSLVFNSFVIYLLYTNEQRLERPKKQYTDLAQRVEQASCRL